MKIYRELFFNKCDFDEKKDFKVRRIITFVAKIYITLEMLLSYLLSLSYIG